MYYVCIVRLSVTDYLFLSQMFIIFCLSLFLACYFSLSSYNAFHAIPFITLKKGGQQVLLIEPKNATALTCFHRPTQRGNVKSDVNGKFEQTSSSITRKESVLRKLDSSPVLSVYTGHQRIRRWRMYKYNTHRASCMIYDTRTEQ